MIPHPTRVSSRGVPSDKHSDRRDAETAQLTILGLGMSQLFIVKVSWPVSGPSIKFEMPSHTKFQLSLPPTTKRPSLKYFSKTRCSSAA